MRTQKVVQQLIPVTLLLFGLSSILLWPVSAVSIEKQKQSRAARSVHLWYPAPDGVIFYNEMTAERSYPGSYFMACGFNHGYYGIQELNDRGDKVVIFSVWDPGNQNNPNLVEQDRRVKVLHEGDGVKVSRFGNEGTGGKSMFPYQWKVGETYRFCVKAKVEGDKTAYAGYFYLNESKEWKHLVTFQTITGGDYLKGYYSFIEDFLRNGISATKVRRASYSNGWVRTVDNKWVPLTEARFTADRTPTLNIDAGVAENNFFLTTGGDVENTKPLNSQLNRVPVGIKLPE